MTLGELILFFFWLASSASCLSVGRGKNCPVISPTEKQYAEEVLFRENTAVIFNRDLKIDVYAAARKPKFQASRLTFAVCDFETLRLEEILQNKRIQTCSSPTVSHKWLKLLI